MPIEIRMPLLGDVMQEGRLLDWLRADQEWVEQGQAVLCIETDKATFELEAPASGRLERRARSGDVVAVGGVVGMLWEERATHDDAASREEPAVLASPLARRLAREHDLDLAQLAGTGPGGRITVYLERGGRGAGPTRGDQAAPDALPTRIPLEGRRRTIAERMHASLQTAAQLTIGQEVDATSIVEFRSRLLSRWQETESIRVTYTDIIVKAAALALREHPLLNAVIADGAVLPLPAINVALAVHAEEGLTVPVLHAADRRSLLDLARAARDLADRARAGRLSRDDLADGSFTVSAMGGYDVDWFTPIINPPQVAILGIGRIRLRPTLLDGRIAEQHVMHLCLTFDHRAFDGVPAARFLNRIAALLQRPDGLLA